MQKKNIITIAGRLGGGKSSTAKLVASKLGYRHFSSGDLFREIAAEQGEKLLDANKAAEQDRTIDDLVDHRLQEIGKTESEMVIDSRTAWHWIPDSFRVYLYLDTVVAAERIIKKKYERANANEEIPDDPNEYAKELEARYASENKRYAALYGIDPSVHDNYDLVIDTSTLDLEGVAQKICDEYQSWLAS